MAAPKLTEPTFVQADIAHQRAVARTTRSQRGTIRQREASNIRQLQYSHAQRRISRTQLVNESIRGQQARAEITHGFQLQRDTEKLQQQALMAGQRQQQQASQWRQRQGQQAAEKILIQPATEAVAKPAGSVVGGIVRAFVLFLLLIILYNFLANANQTNNLLSWLQNGLTTITSTNPLVHL